MRKYNHLTYEERVQIYTLYTAGQSSRYIARLLGRSPNTIARELIEKNVNGIYIPKKAQHKTYWRRYGAKKDCMKVAMDPWLAKTVEEKLKKGWSPERIAGWSTRHGHPVSTRSVYRFVHSRCLERYLFRRKYKRKSGPKKRKYAVCKDGRLFVERRPDTTGSGTLKQISLSHPRVLRCCW